MTTQFADRKTYPVSATPTADGWFSTGIDFSDYARMGTQQRKQSGERRLPTPQWAVNDPMLKQLLVAFMEERAGIKRKRGGLQERLKRAQEVISAQRPRLNAVLDRLCREYVQVKKFGAYPDCSDEEVLDIAEKVYGQRPAPFKDEDGILVGRKMLTQKMARDWQIEIEGIDTLLRYTNGPTAGAGVIAAIVWLYYRVGMDSVGVGSELGLKPPHIRQTLWRLHETARKLWPSQAEEIGGGEKKPQTKDACTAVTSHNRAGQPSETDANRKTSGAFTGAGFFTPPIAFPVVE